MTVNINLDYWVELPEPEQLPPEKMFDPRDYHEFLKSHRKADIQKAIKKYHNAVAKSQRLVAMLMCPEVFTREELKEAYTERYLRDNPELGKQ